MSAPLSDADLDAMQASQRRAASGNATAATAVAIFDTPRLLAEVRRLRADATRAAEEMRERAARHVQTIVSGADGDAIAAAIRALPTEVP